MAISTIKLEERKRAAIIKYSEAMVELYQMIKSKSVDFPALFKKHSLPPVISKKFLQKIGIIRITQTGRIKWIYDGLPGISMGALIQKHMDSPKAINSKKQLPDKIIKNRHISPRRRKIWDVIEQYEKRLNFLDNQL